MDLKLPKLGEGADSGVVVTVFVKEGDTIAKDQSVIELENEKAVASIPATDGGVVSKVYVKVGDKISAGHRILTVEGGSAAAPAAAPKPAARPAAKRSEPEPEIEEAAEEPADGEPNSTVVAPVASPSLRKMARELGIDLSRVRGSGPGGRIERNDLRAYIQRLQSAAAKAKSAPASAAAPAKPVAEQIDFSKWGSVTKKPVTSLRGVIARRMWENWNAIPHVTQFDDADFTRLNELRKKYAAAYEAKGGKLTLTPLVLKAVAATLKKHPIFNSSLTKPPMKLFSRNTFTLASQWIRNRG
jgi:pyruvate dehydrogenase E2 component (dihydrolipoamide acetyltransferase)